MRAYHPPSYELKQLTQPDPHHVTQLHLPSFAESMMPLAICKSLLLSLSGSHLLSLLSQKLDQQMHSVIPSF